MIVNHRLSQDIACMKFEPLNKKQAHESYKSHSELLASYLFLSVVHQRSFSKNNAVIWRHGNVQYTYCLPFSQVTVFN